VGPADEALVLHKGELADQGGAVEGIGDAIERGGVGLVGVDLDWPDDAGEAGWLGKRLLKRLRRRRGVMAELLGDLAGTEKSVGVEVLGNWDWRVGERVGTGRFGSERRLVDAVGHPAPCGGGTRGGAIGAGDRLGDPAD
jgi:hypothetical protein